MSYLPPCLTCAAVVAPGGGGPVQWYGCAAMPPTSAVSRRMHCHSTRRQGWISHMTAGLQQTLMRGSSCARFASNYQTSWFQKMVRPPGGVRGRVPQVVQAATRQTGATWTSLQRNKGKDPLMMCHHCVVSSQSLRPRAHKAMRPPSRPHGSLVSTSIRQCRSSGTGRRRHTGSSRGCGTLRSGGGTLKRMRATTVTLASQKRLMLEG
mmetsp:Transcript_15706/g.32173  ORF Transcript_15706/g.32173 Transcript_15706/m.32173 type:complete len:208 (-) Transcript_15706:84-707(-)